MSLLLNWLEFVFCERPTFIYDDRGELRRVRESAFENISPAPEATHIDPHRLSRVGVAYLRLQRRAASRRYHVAFALCMAFLFLGSLCCALMLRIAGYRLFSWAMLPIGAMWIVAAFLNPIWLKRQAAWRSRILFGVGTLCHACGYELRDVPPDQSGCAVCPECGAAWRLPDTTTPSSPSA